MTISRPLSLLALVSLTLLSACSQRGQFTLHEYKLSFTGDAGAVAQCTLTLVNKGISSTSTTTITSPHEQTYLAEAIRVELKTTSQPERKNFKLQLATDGQVSGTVNGYVGPGSSGTCALSDGLPASTQPAATEPVVTTPQ